MFSARKVKMKCQKKAHAGKIFYSNITWPRNVKKAGAAAAVAQVKSSYQWQSQIAKTLKAKAY